MGNANTSLPDVVAPHNHSGPDLPLGAGAGKIPPAQSAIAIRSQPTATTVGPNTGAGPTAFAVIPEMTTGAVVLPALPPGTTTWVAKIRFDSAFTRNAVAIAFAVAIFVDPNGGGPVEAPNTRRIAGDTADGGAVQGFSLATHKDISLAPGSYVIDARWSVTAGGGVVTAAGTNRILTVDFVAQ